MNVEYEGLHLICFKCGKFGHKDCVDGVVVPAVQKETIATGDGDARVVEKEKPVSDFGPWMIAQTRRQKHVPKGKPQLQGDIDLNCENQGGSRFAALSEIQEDNLDDNNEGRLASDSQLSEKMGQEEVGPWDWALKKKLFKEKNAAVKGEETLDEWPVDMDQAQHSNICMAEPSVAGTNRNRQGGITQSNVRMVLSDTEEGEFSDEEEQMVISDSPFLTPQSADGRSKKPSDDNLGTVVRETQAGDGLIDDPAIQSMENVDTQPRERNILGTSNQFFNEYSAMEQ